MEETIELNKPRRRWYTVFTLSAAAFVDSGENETLAILWPRMAPALGLNISWLGPLLGISDLIRTLTLPLWGWAADRFSRKALLVWITGFWGITTLLVAFTSNLWQLFAVRIIASLGLGVLWPAAFSLLSDLFDSKERGKAAGTMTAVSFSGTLVSFFVLPALAALSPEGWRYGFILLGLVSVLTGILFLFINDPPRGSAEPEIGDILDEKAVERYSFRLHDLPVIGKVRTWWVLLFQNSFDNIALAVLYGWSFTWLDSLGLGDAAALVVGVLTLGTLLGHLFFGWLGDVLDRHYPKRGRAAMAQAGLIVALPSLILFILMGDQGVVPLMVFGMLSGLSLASVDTGARWPIAQAVLRPELRATGRAALDMVVGAVGALAMTLSGRVVAAFGGDVTAMLLLFIPLPKLIALLLWMPVFRTYPGDRQNLHGLLLKRREELQGDAGEGV
jgi:MFS family permease